MKLLVATDAHIFQTPDGRFWCKSIYGYDFWKRYLNIFDDVKIVARMKSVSDLEGRKLRVDGEHVEVFGIPFYQGPKELAKVYLQIQKRLHNVDADCDAALMRMPSQTASMVYSHLNKKTPVAGEIVYDMMDDVNQRGQGPVLRILNIIISNNLKRFCKKANGVSYVTEYSIQKHYPSYATIHGETKNHFDTFYSTITLNDNAFTGVRCFSDKKNLTLVLSSVAMNSERKGEKIVIDTVKKCRDKGYNVSAILIGDGTLRHSFEDYACERGVQDYIEFTGLLPSSDHVREVMQKADVFMFPTQGEGLPRGILEAMAIGMPVLSTPVGGIPEVINKKYLFDPFDSDGFSNMICHLMDETEELNQMSYENYEKAQEYRNSILQERRDTFYKKLRDLVYDEKNSGNDFT
jgi:hypothetical protein